MAQSMEVHTDWLGAKRVAHELGVDYNEVLRWAKRKEDPLPALLLVGNTKEWRVFRADLYEWLQRNSRRFNDC